MNAPTRPHPMSRWQHCSHVADAAGGGGDPIASVSLMAAQPGDLVVYAGSQVGIYVGGGKMRQQHDRR